MLKITLYIITIVVLISLIIYKSINLYGKKILADNPLLSTSELPNFPEIKPSHFEPALKAVINNFRKVLFTQVIKEKKPTWENTITPLDVASNKVDHVWKLISHLNSVSNTPEIRKAFEKVLPKITNFSSEIMQNEQLYKAHLKLKESKDFNSYNQAQRIIINHAIRSFKLSGVNLPEKERFRLREIKQKLSTLENKFEKNILDSTQAFTFQVTEENKDLLNGLPEHTIALAKQEAIKQNKPGWLLTIDYPCYSSVITFAKNDDLRKILYTAFNTIASDQGPNPGKFDNTKIINEILKLKQELAILLGYKNYAEYAIVEKMLNNTKQVMNFLTELVDHSKPLAQKEFDDLKDFAKNKYNVGNLNSWDIAYYSELYQQDHYKISKEALRPYFPESHVLSGMFKIVKTLYGISIEEIHDFPKWCDSVRLFSVTDQEGKLRGKFYIDLYAREFKRSGAWMSDYISRMRMPNGVIQTPIAFLEANFTPPTKDKPALLSHDEVITLFHEFGHTLHHVLTQVDYIGASGINGVAWDAVELPSQFMENWAWEWDVIQNISKHYKTGESLPREEFDKLLAVKNFQSALKMIRQLEFAIFDFRLYMNETEDQGKTVQQILDDVRNKVSVIPVPSFNRFQDSFSHIFAGGYDAGYFSYKWSEVLSSDAFEKFKENGTINPEIGKQFLHSILEKGGSREAMDLFVEFRGREPSIDALLRHSGIE